MGFIVANFKSNNFIRYTNVYISLLTFSLSKESNNWKCRFVVQAHRSREEKLSGIQGIFLTYNQQMYDFIYDIYNNIYDKF